MFSFARFEGTFLIFGLPKHIRNFLRFLDEPSPVRPVHLSVLKPVRRLPNPVFPFIFHVGLVLGNIINISFLRQDLCSTGKRTYCRELLRYALKCTYQRDKCTITLIVTNAYPFCKRAFPLSSIFKEGIFAFSILFFKCSGRKLFCVALKKVLTSIINTSCKINSCTQNLC